MKTTYSNGHFNLHLSALLDTLDDEAKRWAIEHLACENAVIKAVTEQILDGWTEDCSHGAKHCLAEAEPRWGLDWATRAVAKRAGEVAVKEIERLELALKEMTKDRDYYRDLPSPRRY